MGAKMPGLAVQNKPEAVSENSSPAVKALRTARWARIMTKWLVTHSSKGGVKWQVVSFNGAAGQESKGIVDMIAIRKNHGTSTTAQHRGDLFEIILIQVKGGKAKFPSPEDVERLVQVKKHHRADKVILTEWKRGETLCCYVLPDMSKAVPASEIFGKLPKATSVTKESVATMAVGFPSAGLLPPM